jgi:O-antigen/teichoic acid export membrane protein
MTATLKKSLLANYAALGVLAVSGLATNFIIAGGLGTAAIGVFNQAYAIYGGVSQVAVLGVHLSVLRSVSIAASDAARRRTVSAALVLASALGTSFALTVWLCRSHVASWLDSPEVGTAVGFVAPALALLTVNKILMAVMNGAQMMMPFAALQATRSVVIIGLVAVLTTLHADPGYLASAFLMAEVIVLVAGIFVLRGQIGSPRAGMDRLAIIEHIRFGLRGSAGHIALGVNARVDVLILGYFMTDRHVGLYTLAATFAEGIYQGFAVVKNILSPKLVQLFAERRRAEVADFVNKSRPYMFAGTAVMILGITAALFLVSRLLPSFGVTNVVIECFLLLAVGLLVASGFAPFETALVQGGLPERYSAQALLTLITTIGATAVLIPVFGVRGAAAGAAVSLCMSGVYITFLVRRHLGVSLGFPARASVELR